MSQIALLIGAFLRLNVVGLVYMILLLVAVEVKTRKVGRYWPLMMGVVFVLLLAQYASVLGLPGNKSYPWHTYLEKHYPAKALFRWLFMPNILNEQPGDDNEIVRAPSAWHKASVRI